MDIPSQIATLDRWAEWGRAQAPTRSPAPDWSTVDLLVEAARSRLEEDSRALCELLEQSKGRFRLPDPLLCDLGVHRWLREENSYSDWLAWALSSLRDAKAVLRVLGIPNGEFERLCDGKYDVDREWPVAEGKEESTGRIDLLIRFKNGLLGVEVKTEDKQYEKQKGYKKSLDELGKICGRRVQCVLIANHEVPNDQLYDFNPRKWEDLSIALRREVVRYTDSHEDGFVAAMMVGLIAAIEQNVLGFGTAGPTRAQKGQGTLISKKLLGYLRRARGPDGNDTVE